MVQNCETALTHYKKVSKKGLLAICYMPNEIMWIEE